MGVRENWLELQSVSIKPRQNRNLFHITALFVLCQDFFNVTHAYIIGKLIRKRAPSCWKTYDLQNATMAHMASRQLDFKFSGRNSATGKTYIRSILAGNLVILLLEVVELVVPSIDFRISDKDFLKKNGGWLVTSSLRAP